ncbi:hypothetical protein QK342_10265 [Myroides odoratimimus]|uniref:hypothetical protein n=1 Tax=Myroides odoratimimus TaxID=76832 RepID=UPI00103D1343|nr:hypothetical protein [Myroides odoratimimus]MDM1398510.1 hypothetical protein [Myroides odoratimimus]MDM1495602.1 hypothetical protein [Myroides odoratimimus]QBK76690.1 hypothetical protein E0Z07_10230 [Myroides odoratimimus]WHT72102.1 hypothetical protein QK342_10265 [Myroides odoratimimus]WHU36684.1 hypothetical protein QNM93_10250 [Myroides odoratimimus]
MDNKYLNTKDPKDTFKVPEDYFANLESRVLANIDSSITPTPKIVPLYKNRYIWTTAAAAIALLFGIKFFFSPDSNSLNKDSIENYLEYNQSFSLNNDIINALDEEDFNDLKDNIEIKQSQIDHYVLSHIDIEYYLNE